jgi:hypothetical protein
MGSEIRDPEKIYPGSRGQKGTGSQIRNTDIKIRICYWLFGSFIATGTCCTKLLSVCKQPWFEFSVLQKSKRIGKYYPAQQKLGWYR